MNNRDEQELNELLNRVQDLEYQEIKEKYGRRQITIKPKVQSAEPCELRSTRLKNGKWEYKRRTATGNWILLPEDTKLWPKDLREMRDRFAEYDKRRLLDGRLVSNYNTAMAKPKL